MGRLYGKVMYIRRVYRKHSKEQAVLTAGNVHCSHLYVIIGNKNSKQWSGSPNIYKPKKKTDNTVPRIKSVYNNDKLLRKTIHTIRNLYQNKEVAVKNR